MQKKSCKKHPTGVERDRPERGSTWDRWRVQAGRGIKGPLPSAQPGGVSALEKKTYLSRR